MSFNADFSSRQEINQPRKLMLPNMFQIPTRPDPKDMTVLRVVSKHPLIQSLRFEFFTKDAGGMLFPEADKCFVVYEALDFTDRLQPHLSRPSTEPVTIGLNKRGYTPDPGSFKMTPAGKYDHKYDPCLDA